MLIQWSFSKFGNLVNTMIIFFLILIIFSVIGYRIKCYLRFRRMINAFPGRTGHFLLGNIINCSTKPDEIFLQFRELSRDYPNGYRFWAMHHGVVAIFTPESVEALLSSSKYIKKSKIYNLLHPWLQQGLLTSAGEKWQHRRKLLTPAFHFNVLRRMISFLGDHNKLFIQQLQAECEKDKTNVVPIISQLALSIICGASMGVSLDPNAKKQIEYRNAIHQFTLLLTERAVKPWLFPGLIYIFTPLYRTQKRILKILHKFTRDVIEERKKTFDEDEYEETSSYSKNRYTMLDLLLYAKSKRGAIDDEGIREEVDTFMFGGHDTVSIAISFALMVIANEKEHQERIIKELDGIFGDSERTATYQDLQNMQYLELCLKECLRLYPSVPFISRKINKDLPLPDSNVIPAGAVVHVHIYDLHRNPRVYPNPEKFDPSRFLPENCKSRHPFAYIPFSAGHRNCIGQKFAMLELKSIVSTVLRHFEIRPIDTVADIRISMEMVLRPREGIHVKFVPRRK